ncbi:MAG TPA: CHRD domain-containing protein, partial [Polyangia bacterium]|nr:CHRD domain-containing protein [Polyangia bacterium]
SLTGTQEVPANTSAATGNVQVMLNKATGAITVTGSFQNLSSTATAAHIHGPAAVGSTAAVIMPLTVPSATSGTVTGTATMSTVQMNDMLNQMTYVNIHSTMFPDGEIRAQVK